MLPQHSTSHSLVETGDITAYSFELLTAIVIRSSSNAASVLQLSVVGLCINKKFLNI